MNERTTFGWSFDEDLSNYERHGYSGIGVCRDKLAMFGEEEGLRLLFDSQLKASSLSFGGGFTGEPHMTRQQCIDEAERTIQLACCMDADCLILKSGGRSGHTINHARRLIRDAVAELVDMAESAQVDLAIEPTHASGSPNASVVNTLAQALEIIERIGSPRLKLAFDTYHLGFGDVDLSLVERAARHVAVVQLGDGYGPPTGYQNRCPIGEGIVPNADIISALSSGGYSGFYEIELYGPDGDFKLYNDILTDSLEASLEFARGS